MLLPFMYIPTSQDISHTTNSGTKQKQPKVSVKPSQKSVSESDGNSSSDSDEPSCVIPIRRNSGCRRKTPPKCSNLGENGNYHYSRYSDVTTKGDNISNLSVPQQTQKDHSVNRTSTVNLDSSNNEDSISRIDYSNNTNVSFPQRPQRNRRAPDRYGNWVMPMTASLPNDEIFV